MCTADYNIEELRILPRRASLCFVWISQQIATISQKPAVFLLQVVFSSSHEVLILYLTTIYDSKGYKALNQTLVRQLFQEDLNVSRYCMF